MPSDRTPGVGGGTLLFSILCNHLFQVGTLAVIDAAGRRHAFGGDGGPSLTIRFHDKSLHWRLFLNPALSLGEAYMDGKLTVEDGTIYDLLELSAMNAQTVGLHPMERYFAPLGLVLRRLHQFNPVGAARDNVSHHYDLSGALYDLFLDTDRQYSCAYFEGGDEDLELAQEKKRRHIAAKLLLEPDHKVLDIGSGWGGLALHLAGENGVDVTGVTLSTEQYKVGELRAIDAGMSNRVRFIHEDYRHLDDTYDRIVSVGMFEHVGIGHFDEFFAKLNDLLRDDGVALLHTIGRAECPGVTDPWIRKYIFPGGYIPALSEIAKSIEKSGLWITDIEILRLHYADTLRHWRTRFLANRAQVVDLYDERFALMWEYYLAVSEVSFRYLRNVVFQIQLAKNQDAVPLTRDYMVADRARPGDKADNAGLRAA